MIQQTSILAYDSIKHTLPRKCLAVYGCLRTWGPMTNEEIADRLGWPINCVTGRTNSLVNTTPPLVENKGYKLAKSGRKAIIWGLVRGQQQEMFI